MTYSENLFELIDEDEESMRFWRVMEGKARREMKASLFVLSANDERRKRSEVRRNFLIGRKGDLQALPSVRARAASDQGPRRAFWQFATLQGWDQPGQCKRGLSASRRADQSKESLFFRSTEAVAQAVNQFLNFGRTAKKERCVLRAQAIACAITETWSAGRGVLFI